jgi:hypothetical protein
MRKRPHRRKTRGGPRLTVRRLAFRRAYRAALFECLKDDLIYGCSYIQMIHGIPYRVDPLSVVIVTPPKR